MEKTLAHSVYFWLQSDASAEDRSAFEKGVSILKKTPGVIYGHVGKPAGTRREIIDFSYDYNLLLIFENQAAQDAYQTTDANHQNFIATCKQYWQKIQIYDSLSLDE